MCAMDLASGLQMRPLTMADAVSVANLVRASEIHDVGEALIDDEDIVGDWQRPSFDLARWAQDRAAASPPGYAIREMRAGDERAAYQLIEDAFNECPDRQPKTFDDWAAGVVLRPGFEPWQLRLVCDAADTPVGASFLILSGDCGYVDTLAVRADQRGRGLARALLVDSFDVARLRGAQRSELSTDSRTGALGVYLRAGMEATSVWRHLAIDV